MFGGYFANIAKLKCSYLRSSGDQSKAMQKPHMASPQITSFFPTSFHYNIEMP